MDNPVEADSNPEATENKTNENKPETAVNENKKIETKDLPETDIIDVKENESEEKKSEETENVEKNETTKNPDKVEENETEKESASLDKSELDNIIKEVTEGEETQSEDKKDEEMAVDELKELSENTEDKVENDKMEVDELDEESAENEDKAEKKLAAKLKGTPTVKAFSSATQRPKPQQGSFSLGVPGLTFSSQNLKVANDGTKMVQIHQSQITPDQLKALQANPNIKVVFRHIPSGKSFTKPPKNLFSSLTKGSGQKRRLSEEGDASIYNFDDELDSDYYNQSKISNMGNGIGNRYARYNPIVGMRKRGPGRPLSIPSPYSYGGMRQSSMPTQIQLTDALAKLNKENAPFSVNIHVSQVTHGILSGMELHPDYNIVLTSKHEIPPEQSLEELVKEWEEKEAITPTPSLIGADTKDPKKVDDIKEVIEDPDDEEVEESEEQMLENEARMEAEKMEEEQRMREEEEEANQLRLKNERREKEEAELLAAAMTEKTSRSGRIRKPSRYSLDIARMTKRRSLYGENDEDEEPIPSPPTPPRVIPAPTPPGVKRKGRGRPKKIKPEDLPPPSEPEQIDLTDFDLDKAEPPKIELSAKKPTEEIPEVKKPETNEPRVMLSPADKRMAESMLLQDSGADKKEDSEADKKEDSKADKKEEADDNKDSDKKESDASMDVDDVTKADDVTKESENVDKTADDAIVQDSENKKPEEDATKDEDIPKKDEDADDVMKAVDDAIKASQETKMDTEEMEKEDTKEEQQDGESPSDVLARKLSMDQPEDKEEKSEEEKTKVEETSTIKDFVEEEGDVDNKYRLRKLLQQCSIEEIRSVAIPRALDAISIGDFFLHKADQMAKKDVSFAALYKQLENLHTSISKEATRYSTLLKRANKIGGDRRMEKVILMPIYNKKAADTLNLTSSSIDAHICAIQPKTTAQMIAANSFRMNCKMEPPVHRLNIPDLAEKSQSRMKRKNFSRSLNQPGPNTSPYHPLLPNRKNNNVTKPSSHYNASNPQRGSWKRGYQVRKPTYLAPSTTQSALQEHARMQLASRYQSQLVESRENAMVTTTTLQQPDQAIMSTSENGVAAATMVDPSAVMTTEEGGVIAPEEGKQLVAIGDGQYVELPEGYTLIQTDDGYIIGQPGATFVQGEDGNVYMTSTEENTEITDQVLTTTTAGITDSGEKLMDPLTS